MKKILKMIGITIASIIALLIIIGVLFVQFSPQFGGKANQQALARYQKSTNFEDGKFKNLIETSMDMSAKEMLGSMIDFIKGVPNSEPTKALPVNSVDSSRWQNVNADQLIWFGHSAFLLKLNGKNILIDPMLGKVPSPHPWLGGSRYSKELPIAVEKLPEIDVVIISHDHYDHLDYETIEKLKLKTKEFLVPLGVENHLTAWGINESKIRAFDWWQEYSSNSLNFAFTPSRHFSGRGLTDRFKTLWGSWVIKSDSINLYFSGDSGYGPHFKAISEKYGPFNFAMMECGQYNEKWADIHMMPEETARASKEINASMVMPIHWGAFTLALHTWTDPVERFTKEADKLGVQYLIPEIGEKIDLTKPTSQNSQWWSEF